MGLDISCYSNVKVATDGCNIPDGESWCEADDHVSVYAYTGFTHALTGVAAEATLRPMPSARGDSGITEAACCFDVSESETFGFRAGSYGGYNAFRDALAGLSNRSAGDYWGKDGNRDWPFYELVNFADNEGTLDWVAAKALLEDFQRHRDQFARQYKDDAHRSYWVEVYDEWITGLELAADHGLVCFH